MIALPAPDGSDPGIRASFALTAAGGSSSPSPDRVVSALSFLDLAKAFLDYRSGSGSQSDPYSSPPSGLWQVTECRSG
jgi:hypothetical protein